MRLGSSFPRMLIGAANRGFRSQPLALVAIAAALLGWLLCGCGAKDSRKLAREGIATSGSIELKLLSIVDGVLGSSPLNSPSDFILDHSGNIYVLDSGNNRLLKLDREGNFLKEVGGFGGGVNQFRRPQALAFDGGINILVADSENRRLVRYDRNLNFAGSIDSYLDLSQGEQSFGLIGGARFSNQGDLLLADTEEDRILKLDSFYNMSGEFGGFGYGFGQLHKPRGIAVDSEDMVYVADSGNRRIAVFNPFGRFMGSIGEKELVAPASVDLDRGGLLWVGDAGGQAVVVFTKGGKLLRRFGKESTPKLGFSYPLAVKAPSGNRLYVLEGREGSLKIFEIVR